MTLDINLIHEIPQEVKDAALFLGNYFKKQGIDNWALYDVSSRQSFNGAYNQGLEMKSGGYGKTTTYIQSEI